MQPDFQREEEHSDLSSDSPAQEFPCKIITGSEELPHSSKLWRRAKRCNLRVDRQSLHFLDSSISYKDIDQATIHIYSSAFFFEYGILAIRAGETRVYFGIKYSDFWKGILPFPVERIEEHSPYILFRRGLIIMIFIYIFWEVVKK